MKKSKQIKIDFLDCQILKKQGWTIATVLLRKKVIGSCELKCYYGKFHYWIHSVFIKPKYRGNGYGSELIKECIKRVKDLGGESVLISSDQNNEGAFRLYKKLGFKRYYQDEKDFTLVYFVK